MRLICLNFWVVELGTCSERICFPELFLFYAFVQGSSFAPMEKNGRSFWLKFYYFQLLILNLISIFNLQNLMQTNYDMSLNFLLTNTELIEWPPNNVLKWPNFYIIISHYKSEIIVVDLLRIPIYIYIYINFANVCFN